MGLKDTWIKARISSEEKDALLAFCMKHNINMSELIRAAVKEYTRGK